ncbi:MAG TPA: DUF1501 domain-containing protein [Pyrinomonadaceae bacterium]|jgi:uncharacterized protein (DUF1501 family)
MKRREFLKTSCGALSMTALAAQLGHFGALSALAQKSRSSRSEVALAPPDDYKALVCILLFGGNDGNNTIIPNHNDAGISNYAAYNAARAAQGLALPQSSLLPIAVPRVGSLSYGLHPAFGTVAGGINGGLHPLWALGKMAVVTNVGTLVQPLTRQQYQSGSAARPLQLFSHTDQMAQQQSARADVTSLSGWGGRISDKMTVSANPNRLVPTITGTGGALFANGDVMQPLSIGPAPTPLSNILAIAGDTNTPVANARLNSLLQSMNLSSTNELIVASSQINRTAMQIRNSLGNIPEVTVNFPNTELGNQLKQIARMIRGRSVLGVNRQIFFCLIDGFDTHTTQIAEQDRLLSQFSQASRAFYDEMAAQGLQNQVTQFTLSDFSRTFNPGGAGALAGSDHAWANHMFVIGGGVIGGDFYGVNTTNGTPYPTLVQNGPDDADGGGNARGRWIPTTSIEQYAATLAKWFGLPDEDRSYVFPNLSNFPITNLGFMTP